MQLLIESVRNSAPAVVEELIPNLMAAGEVQRVLQNLLKERIPVRNLPAILEAIADHCRLTKDADALSEYVRQRMGRTLTRASLHADGTLYAFTLDPKLEQKIIDSVRQTELGGFAILEPEALNRLIERTKVQVERMSSLGFDPVCLCSPRVRLYYRRLIERLAPRLAVLSYGEIAPGVRVESMGMVGL
jgi:flagellar biosynthesis protein FlhA